MDINEIFGTGEELTVLQICTRAFVMFFIALALIRFGGMRIFGRKTAFDNVLVIMMGALLVRGIAGATPFVPAVAAVTVLVLIHKVFGWLAMKYERVGMIVKGYHRCLYRNGEFKQRSMNITHISKDDMLEAVRLEINSNKLDDVEEIYIEKNGRLSVIEKEKSSE